MKKNTFVYRMFAFILIISGAIHASAQLKAVPSDRLELKLDANRAFYTFNYPTIDAKGNPIVLSSALMAWRGFALGKEISSVLIGCHLTITSNMECPTSFPENKGLDELGVLYYSLLGIKPLGYMPLGKCVIIIPDYEGYGITSDRPHPYLSQELTSRQVVDAVEYGLKLYQKEVDAGICLPLAKDWLSFSYGYSQGGAVALATQRYIEQNNLSEKLHFAGSVCGDGPYDLITTLRYYLEDDGTSYGVQTEHRRNKLTMPVVMPLICRGMLEANEDMRKHKVTDYFSEKFLKTGIMEWIDSKALSNGDINQMFYEQCEYGLIKGFSYLYSPEEMQKLFTSHSMSSNLITGKKYHVTVDLKEMTTPAFYEYFSNPRNFDNVPTERGDAMKDLHRALVENSLIHDWEPRHRIVFLHSRSDLVVPYGNCLAFQKQHPFAEIRIVEHSTADHTDAGVSFFTSFLTSLPKQFKWLAEGRFVASGVKDVEADVETAEGWYTISGVKLSQKPTEKGIYIHDGKKIVVR